MSLNILFLRKFARSEMRSKIIENKNAAVILEKGLKFMDGVEPRIKIRKLEYITLANSQQRNEVAIHIIVQS